MDLIETCLNQTYHDTIEVTPYILQFRKKPEHIWKKYIDKEVLEKGTTVNEIYIKKKKRNEERQPRRIKI